MIKCNVCYQWQPKQWKDSKWVDTVAYCRSKDKFTTAGESCDVGALIPPKGETNVVRPTKKRADQQVRSPNNNDIVDDNNIDSDLSLDSVDNTHLYEHQQKALEYFKDKDAIALYFEMGVGKSATILSIVAEKWRRKECDALLIVAPNDVHCQWYREQLPLWLQIPYDAQCLFGRGGQKQAYTFDDDPEMMQVVVVNIDTFSTPKKWIDIVDWAKTRKTFIVLDEATVIKNVNAQRTQRMLYAFNDTVMRGKSVVKTTPWTVGRAILTGTPVTNGPFDLWAMCEFLRPNFFGRNWYSFQAHFGMFTNFSVNDRIIKIPLNEERWAAIKKITNYQEANAIFGCTEDTFNTIHAQTHYEGPYKHADELKAQLEKLAPHDIMFKKLTDCVDMPPQVYNTHEMLMNAEQQKCYDDMQEQLIATYEGHTCTALNKITAMIRLQQISSGFICDKQFVYDDMEEGDRSSVVNALYGIIDDQDVLPDEIQWIGTSNPKLDRLYMDLAEVTKPCIVITRFSAEAARIYDELSKDYRTLLITGWKRSGTIEDFKEGKYDIMVANSAVIARGFNLQNSNQMLFYSNTFSLETRLQAEGRIFRLGQTKSCIYTDYIYANTIDEKIVASLRMKRNLLDYIRDADVKEVLL